MNTTYKLVQYDPDESMSCPRLGRFHALRTIEVQGIAPRIGHSLAVITASNRYFLRVTHVEHELDVVGDAGVTGALTIYAVRA